MCKISASELLWNRRAGPRFNPQGRSAGFSLVELLVVVSVTALLMTILLPALGAGRESARQAKCASNLRQIGIAYASYMNDNSGWTVNSRTFFRKYGLKTFSNSSQVIWGPLDTNDSNTEISFLHIGRLWEGYLGGDRSMPTTQSLNVLYCPSAVKYKLNNEDASMMSKIGRNQNTVPRMSGPVAIPYYMRGVPQGAPQRNSDIELNMPLMADLTGWRGEPGNHTNLLVALFADGKVNRFRHPTGWLYDIQLLRYRWGGDKVDQNDQVIRGADGKPLFPGAWSQITAGNLVPFE